MTHYIHDKRTLVHDVIEFQAESTLAKHRAPALDGFGTLASLRLWADLVTERQWQRNCQGGSSFGSLAEAAGWLRVARGGMLLLGLLLGAGSGLGPDGFRYLICFFTWLATGHDEFGQQGGEPLDGDPDVRPAGVQGAGPTSPAGR
jgi:hypothetical protein